MHKAAMDDNSYLITYLRDKAKFKIDDEDSNGNTPLHYACYHSSEYASFWLMGFGHNVNCQNKNGDTPMHMLIKSKKDMYSTKTVRELIFKGANRSIKNMQGKCPIDFLDQVADEGIRKELEKILGE